MALQAIFGPAVWPQSMLAQAILFLVAALWAMSPHASFTWRYWSQHMGNKWIILHHSARGKKSQLLGGDSNSEAHRFLAFHPSVHTTLPYRTYPCPYKIIVIIIPYRMYLCLCEVVIIIPYGTYLCLYTKMDVIPYSTYLCLYKIIVIIINSLKSGNSLQVETGWCCDHLGAGTNDCRHALHSASHIWVTTMGIQNSDAKTHIVYVKYVNQYHKLRVTFTQKPLIIPSHCDSHVCSCPEICCGIACNE